MIDAAFAASFAAEWIAAWNAHDLDRILSHYEDGFTMSSPFIAAMTGEPSGQLRGKEQVGAYWARALEKIPDLRFTLHGVFAGADSLAVVYQSILGKQAVEVFFFGPSGKVARAAAHYDDPGLPG